MPGSTFTTFHMPKIPQAYSISLAVRSSRRSTRLEGKGRDVNVILSQAMESRLVQESYLV